TPPALSYGRIALIPAAWPIGLGTVCVAFGSSRDRLFGSAFARAPPPAGSSVIGGIGGGSSTVAPCILTAAVRVRGVRIRRGSVRIRFRIGLIGLLNFRAVFVLREAHVRPGGLALLHDWRGRRSRGKSAGLRSRCGRG